MLHPRLTSLDGAQTAWLGQVGPYGAWSDLNVTTRWGQGACGMYEASWSMPLPAGFDHPLLRRGTIVEIMDGSWRVGSALVLSEPGQGGGFGEPWTLTATGVGREVEGDSSFYARDGSGNVSNVPQTIVDAATANGWRVGRDATIGASAFGATDDMQSIGAFLSGLGDYIGQRWGVWQNGLVGFKPDPSTPTYHVTPGAASLGSADDGYASTVLFRYVNSTTHADATVVATNPVTEARYGHREFLAVAPDALGEVTSVVAQAIADGILAKSKGRLAWTNGLTVTSQEILTAGGTPADLSKVLEDVGSGCMVRLHGLWDDLLETTGQTYLDLILGEAKYVDGAATIDLNPLGLAPRDLAAVIESITGVAA